MESSGTILAQVYTSRAQIPIAGATVAVTQKGADGRQRLVAIRISDESGRIEPITVSTPSHDAGLFPGGQTPFTLCNIWVQSPGFVLLVTEDVQVFPDTETVQALELIPLPEQSPLRSRTEVLRNTPQNL